MKRLKGYLLLLLLLIALIFFINPLTLAEEEHENDTQETQEKIKEIEDKIQEYETRLQELSQQKQTLASTLDYLETRITLTATQINQTEERLATLEKEIASLSVKIERLNASLDELSKMLLARIVATYKRSRLNPLFFLFSSEGFGQFLSRMKYLQAVQAHDRNLMFQMEEARMNYDVQKELKEEKQKEAETLKEQLEAQQQSLAQQKRSKEELLEITKNDEKKFQELLAAARAEMEAIQSIIAGMGDEIEAGEVADGEKIASIIVGRSPCSTGTHLHFEVVVGGGHQNPATYLKPVDLDWDLCGWWPECDNPFSFSGDWNWPVNGKPEITQAYGMTGYAKTGAYGGGPHTGIDMDSENKDVVAVKEGMLYRGSIGCGGGTLRYVKLDHKDSDIDTYYLHINYHK